jgi:DNA-binding response OmpR family regulator
MRILLAEDDPAQCEPLQAALTHAGHVVDAVEDGHTARWLLGEKDYDLLIVDWMLPGEEGISLCQHYRQAGKTAPVLMLTAKDTTADKVMGLDAGADDYLVKPVDLEELLARVRALRRRSPLWCGDVLQGADLVLYLDTMQIERALWEWGSEPESNAVTARVKRLRQRLRLLDADTWIETVYGVGYRLDPPES